MIAMTVAGLIHGSLSLSPAKEPFTQLQASWTVDSWFGRAARPFEGARCLTTLPRPPGPAPWSRGAYDTHVHVAPDVMERRIDDVDLARRFAEVGLAGFVLKSHYVADRRARRGRPQGGPAASTRSARSRSTAPSAASTPSPSRSPAGRARAIVWMPTVDSGNQRRSTASDLPGAKPPMWAAFQDDLRGQGIVPPSRSRSSTATARSSSGSARCSRVIARHDITLATGHLTATRSSPSSGPPATRAYAASSSPTRSSPPSGCRSTRSGSSPSAGALLERCFTTPHTGKVAWEELFDTIRAVGPEHSVLSSDLGQPFNPPVEDGLALLADRLLDAGFTEEEVHVMAVVNSRRLAMPKATVPA